MSLFYLVPPPPLSSECIGEKSDSFIPLLQPRNTAYKLQLQHPGEGERGGSERGGGELEGLRLPVSRDPPNVTILRLPVGRDPPHVTILRLPVGIEILTM